jgi:hypothetical protein
MSVALTFNFLEVSIMTSAVLIENPLFQIS